MMWLMWHMWVLLALSALVGAFIGWTLRGSRQSGTLRLPPRETPAGATPVQASTPVKPAPVKPTSSPEPAKSASSPAPKTAAPEPKKPTPAPEPKAAKPADPKPASEPKKAGASASAGPDDLTRIKGLGPKAESTLTKAGVVRFEQIASWSAADIERFDDTLNARGRIVRDDWVGQAKKLAKA